MVAQVGAAFERYERALVGGDVAVLTELFWDDPRCVRYGVADRQYGADEIAAWRRAHPSVPPGRRLTSTVIVAVDDRTAVVSTLFGYPGLSIEGRQTQTWVRLAEGWRIVAAHVSEVPAADRSEGDVAAARAAVASRSLGRTEPAGFGRRLCRMDFTLPFRGSAAVGAGLLTPGVLRGPRFTRLFPDVYVGAASRSTSRCGRGRRTCWSAGAG